MKFVLFSGLMLGLVACQPAVGPFAAPDTSGLSLVPVPGGLLVQGSGGREVGFGRDQLGAFQTIGRIEGQAPRAVACGAGRQAFVTSNGLQLVFEGGTFVGWSNASGTAGRGCV